MLRANSVAKCQQILRTIFCFQFFAARNGCVFFLPREGGGLVVTSALQWEDLCLVLDPSHIFMCYVL